MSSERWLFLYNFVNFLSEFCILCIGVESLNCCGLLDWCLLQAGIQVCVPRRLRWQFRQIFPQRLMTLKALFLPLQFNGLKSVWGWFLVLPACSVRSFLTWISVYIMVGTDINIRCYSLKGKSTVSTNLEKQVTGCYSLQRSRNFYRCEKDGAFSLFPYL